MLKEQKESLLRSLKRARKAGDESAQHVKTAVHKAVARAIKSGKRTPSDIKQAAKQITTIAIKDLEKSGDATRAHVAAVIDGALEGAKEIEQRALAAARKRNDQIRREIEEREENLSHDIRHALKGVSETASGFRGSVKREIQTTALDAKLRSADLLGMTEATVRAAIGRAIKGGRNVEKTIEAVAHDSVREALAASRVTAEKVKSVSHSIVEAAVNAAEETGADAMEVGKSAIEGTRRGITKAVAEAEQKLSAGGKKAKSSTKKQLSYLRKEAGQAEAALADAVRVVGHRSGKELKRMLHEIADELSSSASIFKTKSKSAADASMKRIKSVGIDAASGGKKVAKLSIKEAKELGAHAVEKSKAAADNLAHHKQRQSKKAA